MSLASIEGRFVESAAGRIFLSYHPPRSSVVRESAILLFYPGLHETMPVHWAYRQLASQLAGEGWAVARFDYYGTGDSEGETGIGDLESSVSDGIAAARDLLARSGASRLQLIGVRFGAMVAARVSREIATLSTILWDPPASGREYLEECAALQRQMEQVDRFHCVRRRDEPHPQVADGVMGSPQHVPLARQIAAFDWSVNAPASLYSHVVSTRDEKAASWRALDATVHVVDEPAAWGDYAAMQRALIAPKSIKQILQIVARPHHV